MTIIFSLTLLTGCEGGGGGGGGSSSGGTNGGSNFSDVDNSTASNTIFSNSQLVITDSTGQVSFTKSNGQNVTFSIMDKDNQQALSDISVTFAEGSVFALTEDSSNKYLPTVLLFDSISDAQQLNITLSTVGTALNFEKFYDAVVYVDNQMQKSLFDSYSPGVICMTAKEAAELIYKEQAGTNLFGSALMTASGFITGGAKTIAGVIGSKLAKTGSSEFVTWFLKYSRNFNDILGEDEIVAVKFKTFDAFQFVFSGLFLKRFYEISPGTPDLCGNISNIPPSVSNGTATTIDSNSVRLDGTVNPNGLETKAYFKWGATTSYGNMTPLQSIGNGTKNVSVSAILSELSPRTIYYYRLVAFNDKGVTSDDGWFICCTSSNAGSPTITTDSLPSGTVGVNYLTDLSATGGNPPYYWIKYSSSLPPGLSLSTTGKISGTPTTAGTYDFTIGVYDSTFIQQLTTKTLSITIAKATESDTTAPLNPSISINSGATSTTSTSVTLTLSATDNVGVTGYYTSETSTTPSASATGWTTVTSTTSYSSTVAFTLSGGSIGDNPKTVYVWFKDSAGNVSASASDSITLTISDTQAPLNPSVSINSGGTSTTTTSVTLSLSATDNVGVTGYCAKESSTTPSATDSCWTSVTSTTSYSATVSFTLSGGSVGDNSKTVYVWFKDSAGNVSASNNDSITLTISDTQVPLNPSVSINSGAASTTSTSITLTLSATDNVGVTGYCAKESSATPSSTDTCWTSVTSTTSYSATVAFTLTGGSVGDNPKTVYVWFKDAAGNVSASTNDGITLTISDTQAPLSPSVSINSGGTSTTTTAVNLTLSATDNVGVTAYYASETSTTPSASSSGWTTVISTTSYSSTVAWTLSGGSVGDNPKTVYVWFKDSAGNVSTSANDSITLTISDSATPSSPSVSIDSGATSTTTTAVNLTLSATDNVGVTAYYASETSTTPSASASGWMAVTSTTSYSATVSFTLSGGSVGDNSKTVYVWFKDSAGNVSASNNDSITLTVSDTIPSAPSSAIATALSQNNIAITWQDNSDNETGFKIEMKEGSSGTYSQIATASAISSTGSGGYYENTTLTAGTTYCYRIRAYNSAGDSSYSSESCATTNSDTVQPTATTGSATNIASTSATLNGTVNPNGVSTGAFFQYGTTTSYGYTTSSQIIGSGTSDVSVTDTLTGLSANTTYHFRIVATNSSGGTVYGADQSFTTAATTVTDIDGNVYNTVTIGTQVWMKENLKVTKYRNGDTIGTTTSNISGETSPKYQWAYNDNESNVATYGRLYTWYAATDSRGLCPTGWHLPTDDEWTTLTDYLGGSSVAGGKMKEAGTTHWNSPNTSADNSSGWTGLPGGNRYNYGPFGSMGKHGHWWSATEGSMARTLFYDYGSAGGSTGLNVGFSVRCVRD